MSPPPDGSEEPRVEGPRGFAVLLGNVHDGEFHGELSAAQQNLIRMLADLSVRLQRPVEGALTVTLKYRSIADTIEVTGDFKVKEPKRPRARTVFWKTRDGNLSVENPRQTKLPLREVPQATTKPKELNDDRAPVRGV